MRRSRGRAAVAEAGLLGAVVVVHVVDHRVVPQRWHLVTHAAGAGAALVAGRAMGLDDDELGLDVEHLAAGLRVGAVVAAGTAVGVASAAAAPPTRPAFRDERVRQASGRQLLRWGLLEIPLATAVYEELLFRGVLLGLARRRWSDPVAVAVTSGLFGLWHVQPALADLEQRPAVTAVPPAAAVTATVLGTALAGVGFAGLRLRTGSLLAPVLAHTATNLAPLVAAATLERRHRRRASGRADAEPVDGLP